MIWRESLPASAAAGSQTCLMQIQHSNRCTTKPHITTGNILEMVHDRNTIITDQL